MKKLTLINVSFNCPMQKIKKLSLFVWTMNNKVSKEQIEMIYKNEYGTNIPLNTYYTIG